MGIPKGACEMLSDFYGKTSFGSGLSSSLIPMAQRGRKVTLYHKDRSAYGPYAAPINKLLLAFCRRYFTDDVILAKGRLDLTDPTNPAIILPTGPQALDKDTLLIRMGADAGVDRMLDVRQSYTLATNATHHISALSAVVADSYNAELYVASPLRRIAHRSH